MNEAETKLWEMFKSAKEQGIFMPAHMRIIEHFLREQGDRGVSQGEVRRALDDGSLSLHSRLRELEQAGVIRRKEEKQPDKHTGRRVWVFRLTGKVPVTRVTPVKLRLNADSYVTSMHAALQQARLSDDGAEGFLLGWEACFRWARRKDI